MRHTQPLLVLLALALLTACGGTAQGPTAQPQPTTSATQVAVATVAATQAAAPTAVGADSLIKGRTPEGYHTLGRADAPVTITFYSDFF
ncbi:MAG: hypothetical protein OHK0022_23530 [Roseiflexaceae bacterium]